MSGLRAVLLDLDGTLVDTAELWQHAYARLADELGVELPVDFWSQAAGRSMAESLVVFGPQERSPDRLIARLVELATDGLSEPDGTTAADRAAGRASRSWHWLPGARELLVALRAPRDGSDGTPLATALVTSSWRDFTLTLLATSEASASESSASEPTHPFDAIVCGEDVTDGKPAPDGFLRAAALLGVAPDECLVIEDSPTGVAAAEAAGMVVLAVPHAGHLDPAPGRAVRRDLVGLTGTGLVALHARLRSGASA